MLVVHASVAVTAVAAVAAAIAVAAAFRRKRWWLKAHKGAALTGVFCSAAAAGMGFLMVRSWQGAHLESLHGSLGLAVVVVAAVTLALGFLQFRVRALRGTVRLLHRLSGGTLLLLMAVTLFRGLELVGIGF